MGAQMTANNLESIFTKLMSHTDYFDNDLNDIKLSGINQRNWTGDTPLHIAVQLELINDIESMIEYGAEVNAYGEKIMGSGLSL